MAKKKDFYSDFGLSVDGEGGKTATVSGSPEFAGYIFTTTWSEDDKEFVGLCNKHPYLSWLDAEEYKALRGIMQLAVDILTDEKKI